MATKSSQTTTEMMETATAQPNTYFHAFSDRAGPTDHLKVLRGNQSSILLLTYKYMSPALHNASDTYHRHLRTQLEHGTELFAGMHVKQFVDKRSERISRMALAKHLDEFAQPFCDGFLRQHYRHEEETKLYGETRREYWEREFARKEEIGMRRAGWSVEEWRRIQHDVLTEEMMIEKGSNSDRDSDSNDGDEYDHIHAHDGPITKEPTISIETQTLDQGLMASPSPLLASFCYRPGDHSDSTSESSEEDDEDWDTSSTSPPLSPTSSISSDEAEDSEECLSPAQQQKAQFLAGLLTIRKLVEEAIEEDWESKVWRKEVKMKEKRQEGAKDSRDWAERLKREALNV